jgi:tetratricopeptide (TPR) repeat protein
MPGRVLTEALEVNPAPRTVASYETGRQLVAAPGGAKERAVDTAVLEHLRSLGYLDTQSPRGDRNLAAVQFQNGHYAEAAKSYADLVRQSPGDGALHASLGGALGALGRFDEALEELNAAVRLEPLNPEAYHNRGAIYERQGKPEAAVTEYRTALRYSPQYEPSRQALVRLTGSANFSEPRTDAEKLAAAKAELASEAARRGDYAAAMAALDEAGRIAPLYALVYQYRSNVAFLKGDREAAIAALRKALEIEPDNALYRTNLHHLEQSAAATNTPPANAERAEPAQSRRR